MSLKRCAWPTNDPLMIEYHDREWGVPLHDDRKFFEFIVLDSFQAGLSWATILRKRKNFRAAFDDFNPVLIAGYRAEKVDELLNNPGIIRNRAKINATVKNARAFLEIQKAFGAFDRYIWQFVGGKPIINHWKSIAELPVKTSEAEIMSRDLIGKGLVLSDRPPAMPLCRRLVW
jgi:DNA-3-methyladenine glycosylase I